MPERYYTEHGVSHVATDIAAWSRELVRLLVEAAADLGLHLTGPPDASSEGVLGALRRKASEVVGGRPEPGLLLLRDLRDLHLVATHNLLHWEMPAQAAHATKDTGLLGSPPSATPRCIGPTADRSNPARNPCFFQARIGGFVARSWLCS
ncbi:hypothetical protein [Streptomyces sp. NBC_00316]|uniref:hypothetical protein n=1 Tax=Streptomyces sp. NBC_00316 TaxID=2975710 RepID=UPI002E2A030D|nr:hypothetical protein [Streptomyces sp. NBC_00316]